MSHALSPALHTVADVLAEISTQIEDLGVRLCADPAFAQRCIEQLQEIDLIAQKQRSLAVVLRAECAEEAIDAIGVEELRARFSPEGKARQPVAGNENGDEL